MSETETTVAPLSADEMGMMKEFMKRMKATQEANKGKKTELMASFGVEGKFQEILDYCALSGKGSVMETFDAPEGVDEKDVVIRLAVTVIELTDEQKEKRAKREATDGEAEEDAD